MPDFSSDYEFGRSAALRDLECCVLGVAYGATSWTTRSEAHRIADMLALGPAHRLLDVGAGSGWPGLYLAQLAGCAVVLVDLPLVGLRLARERAVADGLQPRCHAIAASAAALPFKAASFDAVSHSDVLCCLAEKESMLHACRRVARPGARMAFSVIAPAPSLSGAERQTAIDSGPAFVDVAGDYGDLLGESGWDLLERADVSDAFARTLRASIDGMDARAGAITEVIGCDEFSERMEHRRDTLSAVEHRLLTREIFLARARPQ